MPSGCNKPWRIEVNRLRSLRASLLALATLRPSDAAIQAQIDGNGAVGILGRLRVQAQAFAFGHNLLGQFGPRGQLLPATVAVPITPTYHVAYSTQYPKQGDGASLPEISS